MTSYELFSPSSFRIVQMQHPPYYLDNVTFLFPELKVGISVLNAKGTILKKICFIYCSFVLVNVSSVLILFKQNS